MQKITSKDVVPHDLPISLIRDFRTFSNLFIFSFVLFTSVSKQKRQLEYWMSTKGIQYKEIKYNLFGFETTPSIHYISKNTFRVKLYIHNTNE